MSLYFGGKRVDDIHNFLLVKFLEGFVSDFSIGFNSLWFRRCSSVVAISYLFFATAGALVLLKNH